jgi:catechol 2,3-dioxygenase-like lactoylglutathione lyase family enzyme
MRSTLNHIQLNVEAANIGFYKNLFTFLGWSVLYEGEGAIGLAGKHGESLWFIGEVKQASYDYDGPGVNHLGIGVEAQADVDAAAGYLREHGVQLLFETPRHRHDFRPEPETYYQVMFESPDRILWEVVYTGPKAA